MIIYANSADRKVTLELPSTISPVDGTLNARILKNGDSVFEVPAIVYDAGNFSFDLPFFLSQEDTELTVDWSFDYLEGGTTYNFGRETRVTVVTPYVPFSTLDELFGVELTTAEIRNAEIAVRTIINAHCGQSFGRYEGRRVAVGHGENTLSLPARLISFSEITLGSPGYDLYGNFDVAGDGWYLKALDFGAEGYSIKADISDYTEVNGVIYNPYGRRAGTFQRDTLYVIDGLWGWEEVPEPVIEAAKLLTNDYAGPDSAYRDRYLSSLTSPDWRIQFHSGAFRQTGNVRADQLLNDYVLKRGWAVL